MSGAVLADRYEIRESIGGGQSSEVFRAFDRRLEKEVALKRLFVSALGEEFRRQREREKRIYSKLSSKHVVPLLDEFEHEGSYYLVFELMEHPLARYTEAVSVEEVVRWMEECLVGLRDIHVCGVLHRDIKPSNIFVDRRGSIRIGDFGVSGVAGSMSLVGWTPEYLAPELIEADERTVGPGSDLYSL
ncbi:MAG: serine/threonine-protein kinase, partial [Bacteroidota bacterium]